MSIFSKVKGLRPKKHAFNLTHQIAQTQNIGQIMPCYLHDGILPNSREKLMATSIVRTQALLAPLQHKVDLYNHFWYVPYRIIDPDFPRFISGEMERKGETYDCPSITPKRLLMHMYTLAEYYNTVIPESGMPGTFNTLRDFYRIFFGSGSLLVYLNYPYFTEEVIMSSSYYDNDYSNDNGQELNIKRLQAYFFILAQNYINENFTWTYGTSDYLLDLVPDMFNVALGDFELDDSYRVLYTSSFGSSPIEYDVVCMSIAKVLLMLYVLSPVSHNCGLPHAWKKDYFTSALPFVQVGSEVSIPFGRGRADVSQVSLTVENMTIAQPQLTTTSGVPVSNAAVTTDSSGQLLADAQVADIRSDNNRTHIEGSGLMDFDSIEAGITINELRAANALQRLKESYARFGTRFQEWLRGFWNQQSSDRSMNLPEWLGGYKVPIQISEIEQNSSSSDAALTGEDTPLGTLAGKGLGVGGRVVYDRHFEEPGVIIGLCFAIPKAVYPTNGLDRFLLKNNNIYDYLTPQMEHLGEQEVYAQELFYDEQDPNLDTFGYQSRYAEYKFIPSRYRGQFADTLDFWHLGRKFDDMPNLSQNFVTIQEDQMRRPFAVEQVENESLTNLMLWYNFDVKYIAPMSRFGTPALLN